MRKKNMKQLALAIQLNMTDKAVSKWERGIACPRR
ncbi:MAG: helix-turn-helix domain-containing protein [Eubacteriales bacterium]